MGLRPPALTRLWFALGLAASAGPAQEAILSNAAPEDFSRGRALVALQNAFHRLASSDSLEESLVATVGCGGDSGTNAAVAGALLGAWHGRSAFPPCSPVRLALYQCTAWRR